MRRLGTLWGLLLLAASLNGCATFSEVHFFASGPNAETERNYFRLKISGNARFSSARYISGYYDERAVDLFFNEMRGSSVCDGDCKTAPEPDPDKKVILHNENYDKYSGRDSSGGKITPLDPDQHGTLVMILSTNANVISDTIGTFAQSNILADSVARMQHSHTLDRADLISTTRSVDQARLDASKARITELVSAISATAPVPSSSEAKMLWAELLSITRNNERAE
ncbi:MAG: hypothetical protein JNN30_16870 [Rhodanobacteraceae bacterium]|nr:hypothetical protein [Rhodanobacteraceae bacterium]